MASNPNQARHQHEAETAAALALLARKRYDLPALVAGKRARPMRRIAPTSALEADLAAPFLQIVRAWQAEQAGIVAAYQNGASYLHSALNSATFRAEQSVAAARRQIAPTIARMERWHRAQWVARIKAATGIDVSMFASQFEVAPELANAVAWNEALATDLSAQANGRIASRAIAAASTNAPATRVDAKGAGVDPDTSIESLIADAVAKAKTRAKNIAVDQTEKTSAGMTRGRAASAGLGLWRWKHYDPQPHPRIEHIRRNNIVYSGVRPPPTMPGEEPFCKCWQQWLFASEN